MIVIVCLLDFHSIFQMALGGTTVRLFHLCVARLIVT